MYKFLILFIMMFVGCVEKYSEPGWMVRDNGTTVTSVERVQYQKHTYLVFGTGRPDGNVSVVHDPDCLIRDLDEAVPPWQKRSGVSLSVSVVKKRDLK